MAHVDAHISQPLDWFRLFEMYDTSLLCWLSFTRCSRLLQIISERSGACHTEPAPGVTGYSVLGLKGKIGNDNTLKCNLGSPQ